MVLLHVMKLFTKTELSPIQFEGKREDYSRNEKILRAFYYYQAIFLLGENVPFTTDYTENRIPGTKKKVVNIFSIIWKKKLMTISSS